MNETMKAAKALSRKQFSRGEMVAIVLIIGVLIAILLPAVAQVRNPEGPHGRMIPDELPDESHRITRESGLSIVAPENWDETTLAIDDFLNIHARGVPGARLRSQITIIKSEPPEEQFLNGARKFEFQGFPAYEKTTVLREFSFDDPACSLHSIYVNRNGQWWDISVGIQQRLDSLPEEFRPYLETIRFPENDLADREAKPDDTQ